MKDYKFAIFLTTILQDVWLKDSVKETLEDIAEYIKENRWKLDNVTHEREPGMRGDWDVYHYYGSKSGKSLEELSLTEDEREVLERLLGR